jgi:hypothetical protein
LIQKAAGYLRDLPEDQSTLLTSKLAYILQHLLPETESSKISKATKMFVDAAIELKMELANEHALYDNFWVDSGARYDPSTVDIKGEDKGLVYLCAFPGLERTIRRENGNTGIIVVKAEAVLQSFFAPAK